MTYTYTDLKQDYVIETLGKGQKVIICDFSTMRLLDCDNLTVGAIKAFFDLAGVKFFKAVASE